ncbi:MAG: MBL fold metallo-hydrolase [Clostridiales bacterium]|nr:MBL fold metallo-hydrolase [Clostridiales bacterium]
MHNVRKITDSLYFVGGSCRRLARFENAFPVAKGVSYNSYLLLDEKNALVDTVDWAIGGLFYENLAHVLGERSLDYLVVQHMEPDHCATLGEVCQRYPGVQIVCNSKTAKMIGQFFDQELAARVRLVAEGDELSLGKHTLTFLMAPMVHWPEVMFTYEKTEGILFSADAFGTFGALNGNIFADEVDFEGKWLPESRRYYANIVSKYGPQVQSALKKADSLKEIRYLCPLHGPIWRKNIPWYMDKYRKWSAYEPEETSLLILYASIYGHTENAADILAAKLADQGVQNIAMYDVSSADHSLLVAEAFRASHLVLCSVTHNAGIFHLMDHLLSEFKDHNLQNRTVAIVQNGSWAPAAGDLIGKRLAEMKNMRVLDASVTVLSALKPSQEEELSRMADAILASMPKVPQTCLPTPAASPDESGIDPRAFFTIGYGLYVLTAREGDKDNGCIINTVIQTTDQPKRMTLAVNKQNMTHDMVMKTGVFNICVLTQEVPFALFERFGFQSGHAVDKFAGRQDPRSENGLKYLTESCNAYLSGKVISTVDCGTHTLFIADVTKAQVLCTVPSVTYAYYFDHIKPKPQPKAEDKPKRGYVCKICGYFHEGDTLPSNFICPVCKHGSDDFEPVGF